MNSAIRASEKSMHDFLWDPDSPHRIGRILIEQKKPNQGMQYLREALLREPEFPESINSIAYINLQSGDLDEKSFRKLMGDTAEGRVNAEYIIGLNRQLNGNTASAIQAYRRCLQIDIDE